MIPSSIKRQALIVFFDFVLYAALWQVLFYVVPRSFGSPLVRIAIFLVSEIALLYRAHSPGCFLMGVFAAADESDPTKVGLYVEEMIAKTENAMTIVAGTIWIYGGSKLLVRWTAWVPPLPLFGIIPNSFLEAFLNIALGLFFIYTGVCWLRLKKQTLFLVAVFVFFAFISVAMSTHLWDGYMSAWLIQQRQFFNMTYDENAIALVRRLMPGLAYAVLLIQMVWVIACRKRFVR